MMYQDWRIANQEKYLKNLSFAKKKYDGKDHDHCECCWAKFGFNENDLKEGYCFEDKKYWICEDCFKDFSEMFNLRELTKNK